MSPSVTLIPGFVEVLPGAPRHDVYTDPADAMGLHGSLATIKTQFVNFADLGGTSTLQLEIGLQNGAGARLGGGIYYDSTLGYRLYTTLHPVSGADLPLFAPGSPGPFNLQLTIDDVTQQITLSVWNTPTISGPYFARIQAAPSVLFTGSDIPSIPYDDMVLTNSDPALSNAEIGEYAFTGSAPPVTGVFSIVVAAKPDTIVADGSSQSTLTAAVTDPAGNPVAGQTVTFAADSATAGAAGTCGPTTDHDDGTYTAKYTSTTVSGDVTITATDTTAPTSPTAKCVIHQTPTAVGNMAFGPPKHGIVRQGRS